MSADRSIGPGSTTANDAGPLYEQITDIATRATERGREIGLSEAFSACAETHNDLWWSGFCWAAPLWFGAGVAFALLIGRL